MTGFDLSPQLFEIFRALIEDASGLHYRLADRELFEAKLAAQAADAGFASLLDYYYRLRYDDPSGGDLRALIESLTVHETYFFRELPPLVELVRGHLANAVETRGKARVWSAACATGEEPLSLAMLLAEARVLDRVELVATDYSAVAIERARSGRHNRRSLREPYPEALARRYLDATPSGISVVAWLRDAVHFEPMNLLDGAAIERLGSFDVILCRNVLIYFSDETVASTIARLGGALREDGVLAVGVSESLVRYGTSLVCEERSGSFFYRRAA